MIDRADQTVNICEMKFSRSDYEITKSEAEDLDNKLETFLTQTNTRKSLMLTMITSFGIKQGRYSGRVQAQITLEDLFK
jgi:hypothetical protein